ncbi:SH3 domain-containing protein [Pseudoroseicyclus tamaricis]|uniref:SH3 domain-containing protein n=1 Tax=Pseudoroseicyclus tamaricis TaxID=2705421 RepID=A0A6B2JQW7_9RHOB|nr:SH3 domain-containing protein [Pseudoroseicyclus tamaricis]NDV00440.1 SH3 domain-containing protein [Pseudoroseicyclus tamaricis]
MRHRTASLLMILLSVAACAAPPAQRAVVMNTGEEELLNMRAGPGLGYAVILGIPEGTQVIRRDCITEVGQLWCRVTPVSGPNVTGYVSADYLATAR